MEPPKMYELFNTFAKLLFSQLQEGENLSLFLSAEESFFLRINKAKIRQSIQVNQGDVTLTFIKNKRNLFVTIPFGTYQEDNIQKGLKALHECRYGSEQLPIDPFCITLDNLGESFEDHTGDFPKDEEWFNVLLPRLQGIDCAGFLTAGNVIQANRNSLGQNHWYKSRSFFFDCSLYTPDQQSVKLFYGDKVWSAITFEEKLKSARNQLASMSTPKKVIAPGRYRTYFAPEAVADLIELFSWNGVSASAYHQGQCALKLIKDGQIGFSSQFSLIEDFSYGFSPRFNSLGELAPSSLPIIENGELKNFLISTKTAKEYNLTSNYAEESENLRSAIVSTGNLKEAEVLKILDTGLYIGNVHYLNWSNLNKGRITGMTHYACFWIENGKLVSPIQDLRFDESIYHLFGRDLIGLTETAHPILETSTYERRRIGGKHVPGILVDNFTYTL